MTNNELLAGIKEKTESIVLDTLLLAETNLGIDSIPFPTITYGVQGRCAGKANSGAWEIKLNMILYIQNIEDFTINTIPHEVAHLIADKYYYSRGHDKSWKYVMEHLGLSATRCHNYDTSHVKKRNIRKFSYTCNCTTHKVGIRVHRKLQAGSRYTCKRCKRPLIAA